MRIAIAFLLVTLFSGAAHAQDQTKLFVLDLKAESGVNESVARMLNELMLAELQRMGKFEIFGQADMASMFEVDQTRDLVGCDNVTCLAELGGAIGADLTLIGSVGAIGKLFVINLKVINSSSVKVVGRWSDTVSGEPSVLVPKIKAGVAAVFQGIRLAAPGPAVDDGHGHTATAPAPTPAPKAETPTVVETPPPAETPPVAEIPPPDAPGTATEAPPAHVTPPPEEAEEGTPIYKTWWLWTAVGVVVAGGATVGIVMATQGGGGGGDGGGDPTTANVNMTATLPTP